MDEKQRISAGPELTQLGAFKRLFGLAWPIIGLNLLQVLAMAIDTAMVGRTPNNELALTGLGYAGQLVFLLMVAMIGLTVGTVASVARAHGAGDEDRVQHILHQSSQLTFGLGVVVALLGNLFAVPLLTALGATPDTMAYALEYLRPLLLGTPFNYMNILFPAILRGVGNTRLAFFVGLVMNVLNVVFNYALIFGNFGMPAFGIRGAAFGTVAAQLCALMLIFVLLFRGAVPGVRPVPKLAPVDRDLARTLVRVGWPAALDMVLLNASLLSIVGMLGRIDERAVGAHAIGLRVQSLAFIPGLSISQATGALVGAALGAGRVEEARRIIRASLAMCFAIMNVLALLILGSASQIVALFSVPPGTQLHDYAVVWITLLGYGMPLIGISISFTGMLQGAGETRTSMKINAWSTIAFQIPLSFILGFPAALGVWGVWAGFPLAGVIKMLWGIAEYRSNRWARVGAEV